MKNQESPPINNSHINIIDASEEEDKKLEAIEEDLIQEEKSEVLEHEQDKNQCFGDKDISFCLNCLLKWVNDYLDTMFTILFRTFSMILCTVSASDSKPEMIPFEIVPIVNWVKKKN